MKNHDPSRSIPRRDFLKRSAWGAGALAFPSIVPSSVLGANAPGNRIHMALIGCGGMGCGDMADFLWRDEVRVVAVCDVMPSSAEDAKHQVDQHYGNQDCATYGDYREMLARDDLDAAIIATPDHWHALLAVHALRAGLDVYGEKPLARSIREGRAIVDAAHRYGRVWQTGSQQRSGREFHRACELVRNGVLGKIERVEVGLPGGGGGRGDTPGEVDWEMWLGPAPARPLDRGVLKWNWRWDMDFSGGQLTDWAGHHIDIALWGLGRDLTGPVRIDAEGEFASDGRWNTPQQYRIECTFDDGLPMVVTSHGFGTKWFGERGHIWVNRGHLSAEPHSLLYETIPADGVRVYKSRDHRGNFLDCVRTRRPTVAPPESAHRALSVALLGEISILTGRPLRWDPVREDILDDPGASRLLGRPYREPWVL